MIPAFENSLSAGAELQGTDRYICMTFYIVCIYQHTWYLCLVVWGAQRIRYSQHIPLVRSSKSSSNDTVTVEPSVSLSLNESPVFELEVEGNGEGELANGNGLAIF